MCDELTFPVPQATCPTQYLIKTYLYEWIGLERTNYSYDIHLSTFSRYLRNGGESENEPSNFTTGANSATTFTAHSNSFSKKIVQQPDYVAKGTIQLQGRIDEQ